MAVEKHVSLRDITDAFADGFSQVAHTIQVATQESTDEATRAAVMARDVQVLTRQVEELARQLQTRAAIDTEIALLKQTMTRLDAESKNRSAELRSNAALIIAVAVPIIIKLIWH